MYNVGYVQYGQVSVAEIRDGMSNTLLVGEQYTSTNPRRRSFWAYGWAAYNKSEVTPESRILINDYERCQTIGGTQHGCLRMWGSGHPGTMQFALCDGSVRGISMSVDVNLLGHLATIAGGEVVTLP
jgi:prepilin-type processing-associated H-X9-DG protein